MLKSDEYRKDLSKYNGLLADVQSKFDEANEKLEKAKTEYSAIEETVVTIESEERNTEYILMKSMSLFQESRLS